MATQWTAGLVDGTPLPAATLNQIGAAWETYTPVLTASTTNPTLGTGSTAQGAYYRLQKSISGFAYIAFGSSGANAGSGSYRISLPIAFRGSQVIAGNAWLYDASAGVAFSGIANSTGANAYMELYNSVNNAIGVTNSAPFTWTNNDQIRVWFEYEVA